PVHNASCLLSDRGGRTSPSRWRNGRASLDGVLFFSTALAGLLFVLTMAIPAQAQAIIEGGTVIVPSGPTPSPWNVGGTLIVGNADTGTLIVQNDGDVSSDQAIIGN